MAKLPLSRAKVVKTGNMVKMRRSYFHALGRFAQISSNIQVEDDPPALAISLPAVSYVVSGSPPSSAAPAQCQ